ncbi:MAG TPA: uracil-DNA glycosylase [Methylophilaceae bacterium]|jgi:uracil-DNA glycosylase family 4
MALSREDVLRELELLPVWKQREPIVEQVREVATPEPAVVVAESAAAAEAHQPEASPVAMEPALPAESASQAETRRERIHRMDWQTLQSCVRDCTACELAATRTQTVFGVGDPQADWMVIGEAPGAEEDRKGEPFVGQAGKLLDNMLAAIGLKRGENVYIANIVKCRPPGNRDPQGGEIDQCEPFLERQLALIQPKLIVAVGRVSAQTLLQTDASVGALRGRLHRYQGIPVIVTYHPAYLLRNLPDKAKAWEDLCLARRTMQALQAGAAD